MCIYIYGRISTCVNLFWYFSNQNKAQFSIFLNSKQMNFCIKVLMYADSQWKVHHRPPVKDTSGTGRSRSFAIVWTTLSTGSFRLGLFRSYFPWYTTPSSNLKPTRYAVSFSRGRYPNKVWWHLPCRVDRKNYRHRLGWTQCLRNGIQGFRLIGLTIHRNLLINPFVEALLAPK